MPILRIFTLTDIGIAFWSRHSDSDKFKKVIQPIIREIYCWVKFSYCLSLIYFIWTNLCYSLWWVFQVCCRLLFCVGMDDRLREEQRRNFAITKSKLQHMKHDPSVSIDDFISKMLISPKSGVEYSSNSSSKTPPPASLVLQHSYLFLLLVLCILVFLFLS